MRLLDGTYDNAWYDPYWPGEEIISKIKDKWTYDDKESVRRAIYSAVADYYDRHYIWYDRSQRYSDAFFETGTREMPVLDSTDLTCAMMIYENSKDYSFDECITELFNQTPKNDPMSRYAYSALHNLLKGIS